MSVAVEGNDGTKAILFNESGQGVGIDFSNSLSTLFPNVGFDDMAAQYTLQFDIQTACWGAQLGLAYDNNDSGITIDDSVYKAFTLYMAGGCNSGEELLFYDKTLSHINTELETIGQELKLQFLILILLMLHLIFVLNRLPMLIVHG
jgi:hypothetical protein